MLSQSTKSFSVMSTYYYKSVQWLPVTVDKAWEFFSSAKNLAKITPEDMKFRITSELQQGEIYEGMLIEYSVRPLLGIPVFWRTKITEVNAPKVFKDSQLKGPFALWEHTHTFTEQGNGTLMQDTIKYRLPFGVLGRLVHRLVVKKRIDEIFSYRRKVLEKLF